MVERKVWWRVVACGLILAAVAACSDQSPTAPRQPEPPSGLTLFGTPSLVSCPTTSSQSATATIDPLLGGVLSLGGTKVTIPAGAILEPTEFTLTVPASQYMEIDVSATGHSSFLFQLPVTVTIDYSRCTRLTVLLFPVSAWHIDSSTHALLENMLGVDNKLLRQITFTTGHLSGYAIAQ